MVIVVAVFVHVLVHNNVLKSEAGYCSPLTNDNKGLALIYKVRTTYFCSDFRLIQVNKSFKSGMQKELMSIVKLHLPEVYITMK